MGGENHFIEDPFTPQDIEEIDLTGEGKETESFLPPNSSTPNEDQSSKHPGKNKFDKELKHTKLMLKRSVLQADLRWRKETKGR